MGAKPTRIAFVETVEHGAIAGGDMHEWVEAASALRRLGYHVVRFTPDELEASGGAHRLGVTAATPVVGRRSSLRHALRACAALGADEPLPERIDYPACLASLRGRKIEAATLQDALDAGRPVFVKPRGAEHVKLFTGFVLDGDTRFKLERVPAETPVWISEVIEGLAAEWRVYVLRGRVQAAVCYAGDGTLKLDEEAVRGAAACLHASSEGSAAFALDVGVAASARADDSSGARTVLIEVNDGFSLGLYPGCPSEAYARMMVARWDEMAGRRTMPTNPENGGVHATS